MSQEDTLIEFSIIPVGKSDSDSVSSSVAKAVQLVRESSLENETHSMGTIVEGQLDECLDLFKKCLREVLTSSPRVNASLRLDLRPGHANRIKAHVQSVEQKLET